MKITGYNIQMGAKSMDYQVSKQVRAQLSGPGAGGAHTPTSPKPSTVSSAIAGAAPKGSDSSLPSNLYVLKQLLEYLTGTKINEITPETLTGTDTSATAACPPQVSGSGQPTSESSESTIVYEENTTLRYQSSDFSAQAHIRTSDGREIDFKLSEHQEKLEFNQDIYVGAPRDPLILNSSGTPISSDRTSNGIPVLNNGAYIAYDSNGNHKIDGPDELLGYKSGDAFADLRALDSDGNNWIDEGDTSWSKLYTWDGSSSSNTLSDARVGALFTGAVGTHFEDGLLSERQKSVALMEDGSARVLTRVDINA